MTEYLQALPSGFRFDEYEIERVLGTGGFGITYLGLDHNLGHRVAIKEYLPSDLAVRVNVATSSGDGTMSSAGPTRVLPKSPKEKETFEWGLERFLEEARTLALFSHPNLIRVLRFFPAHGTACIVMEYAEGESLGKRLQGGAKLTEAELRQILFPVLDGLEVVHDAGYLHRDIKPGNIIIRPDGSPVLLDFGAARQAIGTKTQTLTSILSPGYAPIEQYGADNLKQGPWTDLYAFGALCYRAITGAFPAAATDRVYDDPMAGWTESVKDYDPDLLAAIDAALRFKGSERPQSIDEWRSMLASSDIKAATRLTEKKSTPIGEKAGRHDATKARAPGSGKKWRLASAGAALTGVIVVAGFFLWQTLQKSARLDDAAWSAALGADTVEALEAYVVTDPNGRYVVTAQARIAIIRQEAEEEIAWAQALEQNTIEAYQAYLSNHGEGAHASEAAQVVTRADREAWSLASVRNSVESYEDYLAGFPGGANVSQAKTRIGELKRGAPPRPKH